MDAKKIEEFIGDQSTLTAMIKELGVETNGNLLVYTGGQEGFFGLGYPLLQPLVHMVNALDDYTAKHLFCHIIDESYVNELEMFVNWANEKEIHKRCKLVVNHEKALSHFPISFMRSVIFMWPIAAGAEFFLARYIALHHMASSKLMDTSSSGEFMNKCIACLEMGAQPDPVLSLLTLMARG